MSFAKTRAWRIPTRRLTLLAGALLLAATGLRAADAGRLPTLYPFLRDGKWGYVDAAGAWVIAPRFGRCIEMFEGERVRVWQGGRWGYLDRAGQWSVEPQFTEPICGTPEAAFEVVSLGKKQGILSRAGRLLLPPQYDEVTLAGDRAWVRRGARLGLFALDGHWLKRPSLAWPRRRALPIPTAGGQAAWFRQGGRWGLLAANGHRLFTPRFPAHVMGRWEGEEWKHPEGLDFKGDRAWVKEGRDYLLITAGGKMLARKPFAGVREWADGLDVFTTKEQTKGLVAWDGKVVLPARFSDIRPLQDDRAVVVQQVEHRQPDGSKDVGRQYGYIDGRGRIVAAPGIYNGPGTERGQTELAPFAEGLAPVWNESPAGARAGYIDRTGALAVTEQFSATEPFSEGLGGFRARADSQLYEPGLWGYVGRDGVVAIAPQFKAVTPFCRGRAWALQTGGGGWAMIDRTGNNVLTDHTFEPPERRTGWWSREADPSREAERLLKSRWRGGLAVIARGEFEHGLATADGQVLIEPIYNLIGEFHDGVAVAVDSRGRDAEGNVTFTTALLTERGETLAAGVYTEVSNFEAGLAWASHRWTDHRGPYRQEGWGLIDTAAQERTALRYVRAPWVWSSCEGYLGGEHPHYAGELAPVALAEGFQQYGQPGGAEAWQLNSWGYLNRKGEVVAWHEKEARP